MSYTTALLVSLLLLAGNAFFVGAEFAVMSARRSQLEPRAAEGNIRAKVAIWAMEHVSLMLACCQLGITLCSLGLGAVAKPAVADRLKGPFDALGLPEDLVYPVSFAIALAIVVYLHVVLGEMVPKNIAIAKPEQSAIILGTPLVWTARVVRPIIHVLNAMANGLLRIVRIEPKDEVASTFTVEQVQAIVTESRREGLLTDHGGVLSGALEFSDTLARDVMVPTSDLVMVGPDTTPAAFERMVARTGYSRFPTRSAGGDIVGYLHLKDVLYADDHRHSEPIPAKRIRDLERVRPDDDVEDVLAAMQRSGTHLARVLDRDGVDHGVVFLEDVLEELVGTIKDVTRREDATGRNGAMRASRR
jgi:CBS domain containing-hemolysin-like protein